MSEITDQPSPVIVEVDNKDWDQEICLIGNNSEEKNRLEEEPVKKENTGKEEIRHEEKEDNT
jgi:hypothetical protein